MCIGEKSKAKLYETFLRISAQKLTKQLRLRMSWFSTLSFKTHEA
jgi:hypothetical protein